jgi:hypothetical protein
LIVAGELQCTAGENRIVRELFARTALFATHIRRFVSHPNRHSSGLENPTIELVERIAKGMDIPMSEIGQRAEALLVVEVKRSHRRAKRRAGVTPD